MSSALPPAESDAVILEASSISKVYRERPALIEVDLSVRAGELVAITGPSGSGKSTLLHCLSGLVAADEGQVWFRGTDLARLSDAQRSCLRRTAFGILFQFGQLVPELTVEENVALPLLLEGNRRREALAAAEGALGQLGVDELRRSRPGELSGGQAQRVALARAVVTGPAVVFADEPTGALDSRSGAQVLGLLRRLADAGTAVVLVTHDRGAAGRADRIVELRDGRTWAPSAGHPVS